MIRQAQIWLLLGLVVIVTAVIFIYRGMGPAQESLPPLQIISPSDGAIVEPGETILVVVELAPGTTFANGVGILGEIGGAGPLFSPPFAFPLIIPTDASVGSKRLKAIGSSAPGIFVDSPVINIIVERRDSPIQLNVNPFQISFRLVGSQIPLSVTGKFSDGTTKTLTDSTFTTYNSSDTSVAVVSANGQVTAVGPGLATITVQYKDKSVDVRLVVPPHTPVFVDIEPGSDPNSINPGSRGKITVAILTTQDFDATTVDPLSVVFGPAQAVEVHGQGHIEDANGDSDLDLVLHFNTQETGIVCGDTSASLTGQTFDGQAIQGSDSINTVRCN